MQNNLVNSPGLKIFNFWYLDDIHHLLNQSFELQADNYQISFCYNQSSFDRALTHLNSGKSLPVFVFSFLLTETELRHFLFELENLAFNENVFVFTPYPFAIPGCVQKNLDRMSRDQLENFLSDEDKDNFELFPNSGSLKLFELWQQGNLDISSFLPRDLQLKKAVWESMFELLLWNGSLNKNMLELKESIAHDIELLDKANILEVQNQNFSFSSFLQTEVKKFKIKPNYDKIQNFLESYNEAYCQLSNEKRYFLSALNQSFDPKQRIEEDELGKLSTDELEIIENALARNLRKNPHCIFTMRSLTLVYYVNSKKLEALELASKIVKELSILTSWNSFEQKTFIEALQQFNRKQSFSESLELSEKFGNRFDKDLLLLLWIEQATAYSGLNDNERAKRIYERCIERSRFLDISEENKNIISKAVGMSHFQLGRVYGKKSDNLKSNEHYGECIAYLEKLGNHYVVSIARLNRAWNFLENDMFPEFLSEKQFLNELLNVHDFKHTATGFELLNGIFYRKNADFKKSETAILKALNLATEVGSNKSLEDIYQELALLYACQMQWNRVFSLRTKLKQEAPKIYESLKDFFSDLIHETEEDSNLPVYISKPIGKVEIKDHGYPLAKIRNFYFQVLQGMENLNWEEIESLLLHKKETNLEYIMFGLLKYKKSLKEPDLDFSMDELKARLMLARNHIEQIDMFKEVVRCLEEEKDFLATEVWEQQLNITKFQFRTLFQFLFNGLSQDSLMVHENLHGNSQKKIADQEYDLYINGQTRKLFIKNEDCSEIMRKKKQVKFLVSLLKLKRVTKSSMAKIIWQEDYDPCIHDARIYTLVQRTKQLIPIEGLIESEDGAYSLKSGLNYLVIEKKEEMWNRNSTFQTLLETFQNNPEVCHSKSELMELVDSSASTLKRELQKLYLANKIEKIGKGKNTKYQLAK